jgi:CMP-N-acetylneuraminic acid synthetase
MGERPLLFPMEADEAWDIDEEIDFTVVDVLMRERQKKAGG